MIRQIFLSHIQDIFIENFQILTKKLNFKTIFKN